MRPRKTIIVLKIAGCCAFATGSIYSEDTEHLKLSSALFVINRADEKYDSKLDVLNDMLSTRLSEKGFSVINPAEIAMKFREFNERNRSGAQERDILPARTSWLRNKREGERKSLDELISSYSAKKIAELVQADYLIMATINSVSQETRRGTAFGQEMGNITTTMRVSLKVLEGNSGGTVAGTIVEAADRLSLMEGLQVENSDLSNRLLDQCARQVSEEIGLRVRRIQNTVTANPALVEIRINANVESAAVSINGIVYGTTPCTIHVPQGAAVLNVSRKWFEPMERFINPFQGQELNFILEMSNEGSRRWKDVEEFKLDMASQRNRQEIEKEQSSAKAYAKRSIAEGEKKKRENSYIRDDELKNTLKEIIHGE